MALRARKHFQATRYRIIKTVDCLQARLEANTSYNDIFATTTHHACTFWSFDWYLPSVPCLLFIFITMQQSKDYYKHLSSTKLIKSKGINYISKEFVS